MTTLIRLGFAAVLGIIAYNATLLLTNPSSEAIAQAETIGGPVRERVVGENTITEEDKAQTSERERVVAAVQSAGAESLRTTSGLASVTDSQISSLDLAAAARSLTPLQQLGADDNVPAEMRQSALGLRGALQMFLGPRIYSCYAKERDQPHEIRITVSFQARDTSVLLSDASVRFPLGGLSTTARQCISDRLRGPLQIVNAAEPLDYLPAGFTSRETIVFRNTGSG